MKTIKSTVLGLLIMLLWTGVLILGQIPLGFFVQLNQMLDKNFDLVQIIVTILIQLASLGAFIYFAIKKHFLSLKEKLSTMTALKVFLIGYPMILAGSFIGTLLLLSEGQTTTQNQQAIVDLIARVPMVIMFVMIVVTAPVIEELLFRKFLPHYLFKNNQRLGLVIGGILFALFHGPTNIGSFITYLTMSTVLTYVVYRTKRIEYSILLHFLNNAIAFGLMMIGLG